MNKPSSFLGDVEFDHRSTWHSANGKVILFGEHAVVYGVEAVAAAIPGMVRAKVTSIQGPAEVHIANWGVEINALDLGSSSLLDRVCLLILSELNLKASGFRLDIDAKVPPASGLGASAALAVATTRALAEYSGCSLSEEDINRIAYKCEQLAHGSPSGIDNTLATFGGVLRFKRNGDDVSYSALTLPKSIELLVALSGKKGFTAQTVARIREAKAKEPNKYGKIFSAIADISAAGINALQSHDLPQLADLLALNQQCLRQLGVSCTEIEQVLTIAGRQGIRGAKLTGSGDGGAVIMLPLDKTQRLESELAVAGFSNFRASLGS